MNIKKGVKHILLRHALVAEYGPLPEDFRLRFFPAEGKNGETIAKRTAGSESLQFRSLKPACL